MSYRYEIYQCPDCKPETAQYLEDAKEQAQHLAEHYQCQVTVYKRNERDILEYIGTATPFSFGGES